MPDRDVLIYIALAISAAPAASTGEMRAKAAALEWIAGLIDAKTELEE